MSASTAVARLGRAWAAMSTPWLPVWAMATALHPRWRADWRARWGLQVAPVSPGVVWVHAASVGEVAAAEAVVRRWDRVLLTTDTDTGLEAARRIPGIVAAIRPVDHPWTLAPLWAEARPRAVVWVEGAWWPALAALAAGQGTPMARIGARLAPGTRRWGRLAAVDLAACVDAPTAAWFGARGVPAVITGDLKADRDVPTSPLSWGRPFVVGASTRPGDEAALVGAVRALSPRPALLVAPRHLDRVDAVVRATGGVRRTALGDRVPADVDVVVLDTLGELAGCLEGAAAAFIGGTFDAAIGGHSPAEAAAHGVPLVRGPHATANAWPAAEVASDPGALAAALRRALDAPRPAPVRSNAGRLTAEALAPLLGPPAPEASPRPWARPLAGLSVRRTRPRVRLPALVVVVGSDNARGGGKTTTARWAAAALRDAGHDVGVVVRGYRRTRRGGAVLLSSDDPDAAALGDEGALFARDGFRVAAAPDRVAAARRLVDAGVTALVFDDGLSAAIHADVAFRVVDARFPTAGGALPAGWGRPSHRPEAQAIVHFADHPAASPVAGAVATRRPGPWHRGATAAALPAGPVALVCGVARPGDVVAGLDRVVARVRVLRDHAPIDVALAEALLRWAGDLPLVCTAKDHVRLPAGLRERVWWRDVSIEVTGAGAWIPARGWPKEPESVRHEAGWPAIEGA